MSFSIGNVILLPVPFTDLSSRKVRPAIVVGHGSFAGDLFVVPISSQLQNVDMPLVDWRQAGLKEADLQGCADRLRKWLQL
jgi:mRNA interferase MazF